MKENKTTVVLGASPNPARYSNLAVKTLNLHGYEVIPIGIKNGLIENMPIIIGQPEIKDVDTVTLYQNSKRQKEYYDYIFKLQPKRIIFNPGAENPELDELAKEKGIETLDACTLVMLSTGQY